MTGSRIRVILADDNLIVRQGVRSLLASVNDIEVVGLAADYEELLAVANETVPHVVVTDIRMPPSFEREGIDAAKDVKKRHPGTGVVILSQYDAPEYAIALLAEGASGYAYLLKDGIADGDQLVLAIRQVAAGGTMLDPAIVRALVQPVASTGDLTADEETLLRLVSEGRSVKNIAVALDTTPASAASAVEQLFLTLAKHASTGVESSLRRLRLLHEAIVDREEHGETLSRLLPRGVAQKLRQERGRNIGESEELVVTVLMSDIRGYSTIAERIEPSQLASQLNVHRGEMNRAIVDAGGTVMSFEGDSVLAVFGAPFALPGHARQAAIAASAMHERQAAVNEGWEGQGLPRFEIGIGISTGDVAAVLLGSDERLEYTVIGDTVNLAQRLQQWAGPGQTVVTQTTYEALGPEFTALALEPALVKGRRTPVQAYRLGGAELP